MRRLSRKHTECRIDYAATLCGVNYETVCISSASFIVARYQRKADHFPTRQHFVRSESQHSARRTRRERVEEARKRLLEVHVVVLQHSTAIVARQITLKE